MPRNGGRYEEWVFAVVRISNQGQQRVRSTASDRAKSFLTTGIYENTPSTLEPGVAVNTSG